MFRAEGEQFVKGGELAEGATPKSLVVVEAEEIVWRWRGDPGMAIQFVFELSRRPFGVASEGPHENTRFLAALNGVFSRDSNRVSEAISG